MKENNVILSKSYLFSVEIIHIYRKLLQADHEYVLARQLLRCGTSIGANCEEAAGAQSKKDFKAKLYIAYKEARETHYWLRLLRDTGYIDAKRSKLVLDQCEELLKILGSILITLKKS